jgi:hypothetical protein
MQRLPTSTGVLAVIAWAVRAEARELKWRWMERPHARSQHRVHK